MEASGDDSDMKKSLYLLPGCYGRQDVPRVHVDAQELRGELRRRVPWLDLLWRRLGAAGFKCYVTGSMLSAAIQPISASAVTPGDVDLFVEDQSNLEECFRVLCGSVKCGSPSTIVSSEQISSSKLRVKLTRDNANNTYVDLYAHPLPRICKYHMSLVRAAFDGETLYCAPSAASAVCAHDWATSTRRTRSRFGDATH